MRLSSNYPSSSSEGSSPAAKARPFTDSPIRSISPPTCSLFVHPPDLETSRFFARRHVQQPPAYNTPSLALRSRAAPFGAEAGKSFLGNTLNRFKATCALGVPGLAGTLFLSYPLPDVGNDSSPPCWLHFAASRDRAVEPALNVNVHHAPPSRPPPRCSRPGRAPL